jgi:hypothetical protein
LGPPTKDELKNMAPEQKINLNNFPNIVPKKLDNVFNL